MSQTKLVKVDNWGIYFLQRLKNFFNRTDYCDLTLQFQDKAQLKVHRLVLSACTEYFEVLERTCEMYEDCLVMPDDLQADVVVPIINFMYTGQLEFSMNLLEKLYQTSQIMNMPILTKLLNSHRTTHHSKTPHQTYDYVPKKYSKRTEKPKIKKQVNIIPTMSVNNKRSYAKAFNKSMPYEDKFVYKPVRNDLGVNDIYYTEPVPVSPTTSNTKKMAKCDPRPTRYELPEELDSDNELDNSFCNISYTSQPLMVHPEKFKQNPKPKLNEPTTSHRLGRDTSTLDIVECKRISNDNIFEDNLSEPINDDEFFPSSYMTPKEKSKNQSKLFDQITEQNDGPKVTIESKNSKVSSNIDHAKIISEVLKRYPHLMKSNKNIKLKILNTPSKIKKEPQFEDTQKIIKFKTEKSDEDSTYESEVIDSKEAARLISLGAENIKGPWICLICGTPGRALHFTTYYKFRRHLVNVHKEKPVSTICEYCGLKSLKRNYMLHHLYSQHGVPPPSQYNFPKCNQCNYIALTEGFLVKHKLTHSVTRRFRCTVCGKTYDTSQNLLSHIQATGHKYTPDKKTNLQCVYCLKVFLRENNLYAHIKANHKQEAIEDDIIEDSDEETKQNDKPKVKYEEPVNVSQMNDEDGEMQYEIQENASGSIELVSKKRSPAPKQKILNPGFSNINSTTPVVVDHQQLCNVEDNEPETEEIVMIDNIEYVVRNDQLIPRKQNHVSKDDYIISDMLTSQAEQNIDAMIPSSSIKYTNVNNANIEGNSITQKVTLNHPIQIVVSNEEEYKDFVSSNHPIIFNNNNANKTLTVLASNNAALNNSSISINNKPSNDMMIISENYPLSVADTVTTNNSNIVVVYSHPVDNQNKQYQLVTSSQGLEGQFIQSPAIITQNYQTVSNISAAMGAHVLATPENWQNNVHETVIEHSQQGPAIDVQTIENPINDVTAIHLAELPKVDLAHQTSSAMIPPCNISEEILINSEQNTEETIEIDQQATQQETELITESIQAESLETIHTAENEKNIEIEHLNVTNTGQILPSEYHSETHGTDTLHETSTEKTSSNEQIEVEHGVDTILSVTEQEEPTDDSAVEQNDVDKEKMVQEGSIHEVIEYDPNTTCTQQEETKVEENMNTHSNSQNSQEISEEVGPPVVSESNNEITNKNKEILISEWSEDEYDVETEKEVDETKLNNQTEEMKIIEMPTEVEQSVEFTQHNVNNEIVSSAHETAEEDSHTQDKNISTVNKIVSVDTNKMNVNSDEPQKKILSLLNEWEDNDSQEENTSTIEGDESGHIGPADNDEQHTENSEQCTLQDSDVNVQKAPQEEKGPEANIKNLVSDWDDDEDE